MIRPGCGITLALEQRLRIWLRSGLLRWPVDANQFSLRIGKLFLFMLQLGSGCSMQSNDTPAVTVAESGNGPFAQFVTAGHHVMGADEPERLGGRDTGPSPYEYLMAGLGACTAMALRLFADRHRWPLRKVTIALRHQVVATTDGGSVDRFIRTITIEGDLNGEQRAHLLTVAERCPVSRTMRRASEIVTQS
jgi:putative redox protein